MVTTGGQLVLYAPGLPGNWCQSINLRLLLDPDAPLGTVLQNTVVITTPGDVDPNNNVRVNTDARVSPPRYDMRADKNFNSGVLVPGGWLNYHVSYWNQGNSAIHAWVTDTLPSGTSYQPGSAREQNGGPAFPPAIVTDEYVVWDLGEIGVNEGFGLDFTADVSDTVAPGTVLTNCATVGITLTDDLTWNNTDCVTETINASGPNLRVTKQSWWNGNGQLGYHVQFYNIGDQTINDVWITDTLPLSTTWDGSWKLGFDKNRITSQNLDSQVLGVEFSELYPGDSGGIDFNANLDDPNARPRWYTNTVKIVPLAGDIYTPDNTYADVAAKGEVDRAELWMNTTGDSNMWGQAVPGTVTLTTAYTQVTTWADSSCGGCWPNGGPNPDVGPVHPGDTITVTAGAGRLPIVIHVPNPFTAQADSRTDKVWGQIGGWNNQTVEVHGQWPNGYKEVPTDTSGHYTAIDGNVPRGAQGYVRYVTKVSYADVIFHRPFQAPDLILTVNYRDDWVEGNYAAGYTVLITVTDNSGNVVKGTAVLTTGVVPWWGGQTGFSTNWQGWVIRPDIVPDDWVYGLVVDNGYTSTVHVGTITGTVSAASDSVSGRVYAAWFTQTLAIVCDPWGAPGGGVPGKDSTAAPDGSVPYFCQWNPATEWDILPGQDVGVRYQEPDGDWVNNGFREPAPNLRVEKWPEGGGEAAPGGPVIFGIRYQNNGDGAGEAILTDTLPLSTTYVTDTGGFPAFVSGNVITWNLGSVQPYTLPVQFQLVLTNTAHVSDTLTNIVDIGTQYEREKDGAITTPRLRCTSALVSPICGWTRNPTPATRPRASFSAMTSTRRPGHGRQRPGPADRHTAALYHLCQLAIGERLWLVDDCSHHGRKIALYAPTLPGNYGDKIYLTLRLSNTVPYRHATRQYRRDHYDRRQQPERQSLCQ